MKRRDIKPCISCGQGVMHENNIVFYRVKLEQFIADVNAIRQGAGLEMMLGGNAAIAAALYDPDLAQRLSEGEALLCQPCFLKIPLASLFERLGQEREAT